MSRGTYHHGDLQGRHPGRGGATWWPSAAPTGSRCANSPREAGVSHAAPAHHFTDRRGLFTALAAEGFGMLADSADGARGRSFIDAATAYVRFAIDHPGHYEVMFDRSLLDAADPDLVAAEAAAGAELDRGVGTLDRSEGQGAIRRAPRWRRGLWCTASRCCGCNERGEPRDRRAGSGRRGRADGPDAVRRLKNPLRERAQTREKPRRVGRGHARSRKGVSAPGQGRVAGRADWRPASWAGMTPVCRPASPGTPPPRTPRSRRATGRG